MKRRIAVLITVFNRKEHTLECLRSLYGATIPDGYSFDVYITDDGSTDGTSEAISDQYPSVKILSGSGNLFWNRGMINSWKEAAKRDYDYYLWLNNDTYLSADALQVLTDTIQSHDNAIVCGVTISRKTGAITYGGRSKSGVLLTPNGESRLCDKINGNIVLISRYVYNRVGTLDPIFHHGIGDFDYGVRASKAGISSFITPSHIGLCEEHDCDARMFDPRYTLKERLKWLNSPLGAPPRQQFIYNYRNRSLIFACLLFVSTYLHTLSPKLYNKRSK